MRHLLPVRSRKTSCWVLFPLLLAATSAWGQCFQAKILASDRSIGAGFGLSLASEDDRALIGAPGKRPGGAVYVVEHDGRGWVETATLTAPDGFRGDVFGYFVSLSGNVALVGAPEDDDNGEQSGSAYVFRYNGSTWVLEAKLKASDGNAWDYFGYGVSVSGDVALVGAFGDDDGGLDAGAAYVFRYDGSSWQEETILRSIETVPGDYFSYGSVALQGNTAMVGAWYHSHVEVGAGAVHVFEYSDSTWTESAMLVADDAKEYERFGTSIALRDSLLLVGANGGENDNGSRSGTAYIFRLDGTGWQQEAKLSPSDGDWSDLFGQHVAVNDDFALVAAQLDQDWGAAYVFAHDGGTWTEQYKMMDEVDPEYELYGSAVALAGNRGLVGIAEDYDVGSFTGSVYSYDVSQAPCFTLVLSGQCPGTVIATALEATPGGEVAIVYGQREGEFIVPGPNCPGTILDVRPPFLPGAPRIVSVDATGRATFTGNVPARLCGKLSVQGVDLSTCETSPGVARY